MINSSIIPMVIDDSGGRGERAYDIYTSGRINGSMILDGS